MCCVIMRSLCICQLGCKSYTVLANGMNTSLFRSNIYASTERSYSPSEDISPSSSNDNYTASFSLRRSGKEVGVKESPCCSVAYYIRIITAVIIAWYLQLVICIVLYGIGVQLILMI